MNRPSVKALRERRERASSASIEQLDVELALRASVELGLSMSDIRLVADVEGAAEANLRLRQMLDQPKLPEVTKFDFSNMEAVRLDCERYERESARYQADYAAWCERWGIS